MVQCDSGDSGDNGECRCGDSGDSVTMVTVVAMLLLVADTTSLDNNLSRRSETATEMSGSIRVLFRRRRVFLPVLAYEPSHFRSKRASCFLFPQSFQQYFEGDASRRLDQDPQCVAKELNKSMRFNFLLETVRARVRDNG